MTFPNSLGIALEHVTDIHFFFPNFISLSGWVLAGAPSPYYSMLVNKINVTHQSGIAVIPAKMNSFTTGNISFFITSSIHVLKMARKGSLESGKEGRAQFGRQIELEC